MDDNINNTSDIASLVIDSATKYYETFRSYPNGRYRSWEYCYKQFHDARSTEADLDYLSLHLAFYLASWGMYRGSSFLLQKDYKIHIPIIKEILKHEYDPLLGIECSKYRYEVIHDLLGQLTGKIDAYYSEVRDSVKGQAITSGVSQTLITKVLMGTLGCVPAYDRYFIGGVKNQRVDIGKYNLKSIMQLTDFYEANYDKLEDARKNFQFSGLTYPQMKLLDMGFWQIGFELDESKGYRLPRALPPMW